MGKQFTQEQFRKAIPGSGGIYATIAKRVGCAWHTAQKYINDSPVLLQMYEDEASTIDDLAESVVIKAMQRNDVTAAKWWLERRRRQKFATRVETELSGKDGAAVQVEHTHKLAEATDDDIKRTLAALGQSALAASGRTPIHDDPGDAERDDSKSEKE